MEIVELFDVGVENTTFLLDALEENSTVDDFSHRDLQVGVHSCSVSYPHVLLKYNFDVDGIVIELDKVQAIQGGVHYLLLPRLNSFHMQSHYQTWSDSY